MPANPAYTMIVDSGTPLFRITADTFKTPNPADHVKVVNGRGAVLSRNGARYNYPGAVTVYLTEDVETCFAERMFYFQREILRAIDLHHHSIPIPSFQHKFVLWEIQLKQNIPDVFDMPRAGALTLYSIYPSLVVSPSQDYEHLKDRRALVQSQGYNGLRARSSRAKTGGNLIVLFDDQSPNVQSITPFDVEFRLITKNGTAFFNHTQEELDFTAGEAIINTSPPPTGGGAFSSNWQKLEFNH
jgi:RES domain-containing protein